MQVDTVDRQPKNLRLTTIAFTGVLIALTFVDAPYPKEIVLQHIPSVLGILGLLVITWHLRLTPLSFACLVTFLWLHIFGARWLYSYVPYDEWAYSLTGRTLSEYFDWERNHYDRLVHLLSGVLFMAPASEALQRLGGMRPLGATIMAISVVLSAGAINEIIEWQITLTFSPARAEAYNGQQGDIWDPQKDLTLACLGAIVTAGLLFRWNPDDAFDTASEAAIKG